ncbi:hypothetical protein Taro_005685 [Colocasia esculenta]|uniref:Uncharacterized protein n=1 Tax=Colocasia esculenta TaxID=4460 RepID=A0A843TQJ1_COLES|nr:hypothetical protein [Colocasia esculenta]
MWRTESGGFHLRRPRVCLSVHAGRPGNRDCLLIHAGRLDDRDCLPIHAGRPDDRDRLFDHASSATFPFFLTTRWRASIQHRREGASATWTTTMLDFRWRYSFTRPEDLPRARAVWESTAQTNLRKLMYEARDRAMKTTSRWDPMASLDYGPVWLRRDYWECLCHRWATGPWEERSQEAKRNRSTHPKKNVHTSGSVSYATHSQKLRHNLERAPTFRELFDRTHKRKGTDDYVSESARTIVETYDRTMADRYAEGTP